MFEAKPHVSILESLDIITQLTNYDHSVGMNTKGLISNLNVVPPATKWSEFRPAWGAHVQEYEAAAGWPSCHQPTRLQPERVLDSGQETFPWWD